MALMNDKGRNHSECWAVCLKARLDVFARGIRPTQVLRLSLILMLHGSGERGIACVGVSSVESRSEGAAVCDSVGMPGP
jgi:hypothetical protein